MQVGHISVQNDMQNANLAKESCVGTLGVPNGDLLGVPDFEMNNARVSIRRVNN